MSWTSKIAGFLAAAGAIFTLVFRTKLAEEQADRAEENADRSKAILKSSAKLTKDQLKLNETHKEEAEHDAKTIASGRRDHFSDRY